MLHNENETKVFGKVFGESPVYIYTISTDGIIIDVNKTALDALGYSKDELVGSKLTKIYAPDQLEKVKVLFKEWKKTGVLNNEKLVILTKNGERRVVLLNAEAVREEDGEILHSVSVQIDTTELEKIEKEREASLHFLESIDKVNQAIQKAPNMKQMMSDVLDLTLDILKCDRVYLLYPCDPEADSWSIPMARWKPGWEALSPGQEIPNDTLTKDLLQTILDSKDPVSFGPGNQMELPKEVSEAFGIKTQIAMAIFPKVGKSWSLGVHQCTYERKWSDDDMRLLKEIGHRITDSITSLLFLGNLKESEERFRSLIQTAPVVIIQLDSENNINEFNKAAEKLYGEKREGVLGKSYFDLFARDEEGKRIADEIKKIISGTMTRGFENIVVDKNGKKHYVSWNADQVTGLSGEIEIMAIGQDITERKIAEKDIEKKVDELERVNKLMVGRELTMIELKKEIEELKKQQCK